MTFRFDTVDGEVTDATIRAWVHGYESGPTWRWYAGQLGRLRTHVRHDAVKRKSREIEDYQDWVEEVVAVVLEAHKRFQQERGSTRRGGLIQEFHLWAPVIAAGLVRCFLSDKQEQQEIAA